MDKNSTADAPIIEKAADRLAVIAKIDEYEKNQWWTKDLEDDPPTVPLKPDQVDYGHRKIFSKIKCEFTNFIAWKFIKKLVKSGQLFLGKTEGLENFIALKDQGLIMTCNHFNPFDNFAIQYEIDKYLKHHVYWRVIREGNYTSFPGFYGFLFRNSNTIPLSQNFSTQKKFMEGMSYLLSKKQKILVYAEQGMWWNYRKPRPLTPGAFKFAVTNNVPVLPMFITMQDTDKIGGDGFPIQEYTLHILKPIYADPEKSVKENIKMMADTNYEMWKEIYEKVYGIPLTYLTK